MSTRSPRALLIAPALFRAPEIDSANRIAAIVMGVSPATATVLGGPHATLLPREALGPHLDFLVRGEGELPLLALAEQLAREEPDWSRVPALSYRDADGIARGLARRLPFRWRTDPARLRDDRVALRD